MTRDLEINMSRIPVAGPGGLGMVIVVAVIAYTMPVVRDFVLLSVAGGVVGGSALAVYRWWRSDAGTAAKGPTLMVGVDLRKGESNDQATGIRHASGQEWLGAMRLGATANTGD